MNIIELAKQAGFGIGLDDPIIYAAHERFAALVAAHEREECAKIAEAWDEENKLSNYGGCIALCIRARGQQTPEGGTT